METLEFYDLKNKAKFRTSDYVLISKNTSKGIRFFAVAVTPSQIKSYKIISKKTYLKNKR